MFFTRVFMGQPQLVPEGDSQPVGGKEAAAVEAPRPASPFSRVVGFVLFNIAVVLLLLVMCEGLASIYYAFHAAFATPPVAESLHTKYDRDLGWVNLPNVYRPNMYGPGKFLRTNSQGFRSAVDFPKNVPAGKTRIICSGDSFTLAYGVDNDHTWARLLALHAPTLETVNMGQGGYGADQIFLWYKRDGAVLDHDIHILALSSPDIFRMQHTTYNGYGKPTLTVEDDRVVASNVPVPRSTQVWSPRLVRSENALSNLSLTRLLRRVLRLDTAAVTAVTQSKERNEETAWTLSHMLDDLDAANRAQNSVLVLAYLPTREEITGDASMSWHGFLRQYAEQHGVLFLDLLDELRRLPPAELDKLFITQAAVDFPGAAGHYTEAGNAVIADFMYRTLLANPKTAAKLYAQPGSIAPATADGGRPLVGQSN